MEATVTTKAALRSKLVTIRADNPGSPNPVNVCTMTVQMDLCVGCGICVPICPTKTLHMEFNSKGEYIPIDDGNCRKGCHICVDACPFLDHSENEDTFAERLYGSQPAIQHRCETGYYLGLHAGYAIESRAQGTSGGLGRWLMAELLRQNRVDAILSVQAGSHPEKLYEYAVFTSAEQVINSSKSAYYPVEMSGVVSHILQNKGRYAIVGVPCYLKGVRLAMLQNKWLRERIVYTVGLVCGQTKSKQFAEYLIRLVNMTVAETERISFRDKEPPRLANDSIFRAESATQERTTNSFGLYGKAYSSGQFKPNCCNYCDDVFAEVADVILMDAWLERYVKDPHGTSLALTRTPEMEALLQQGAASGQLKLQPVSIEDVIQSQEYLVLLKRNDLSHRLWLANKQGKPAPAKRVAAKKPNLLQACMQDAYEQLRVLSFQAMHRQQAASTTGIDLYHRLVGPSVRRYYRYVKVLHTVRAYSMAFQRRWNRFRTTGSIGPIPFLSRVLR